MGELKPSSFVEVYALRLSTVRLSFKPNPLSEAATNSMTHAQHGLHTHRPARKRPNVDVSSGDVSKFLALQWDLKMRVA